jgi:trigger factor
MYDNETDEIISRYENRLRSQNIDFKLWLQYTGQTMEGMREQAREGAVKNVKLRLALEKIAKLENITPTAEEIDAEYNRLAEMYKISAEQVRSILPEEGASADLAVQKAMDLVKENAKVED